MPQLGETVTEGTITRWLKQVGERIEPEMRHESLGRAVRDRPAGRLAPAPQADPAGFQKHIERPLRGRHAANILDLGTRHRLVIGDDRQHLDRRT